MSTRRRSSDDFRREIESHLAHAVDEFVAQGLTPDDAQRAALRQFGNVTHAQERFFETHRPRWFDELRQDVAAAARMLRRYPVAAAAAVVSLAFGIGAATVTLTIRDVIFHKPPPMYSDPGQLSIVRVGPSRSAMSTPYTPSVPAALFRVWRDSAPAGAAFAASLPSRPADVRTIDRIETVQVRAATANLFALLGVKAHLGRATLSGAPGADRTAVLGYRVWQRVFAGNPSVVGTSILINDIPYTVAGVLPEAFWFAETRSSIWTGLVTEEMPDDALLQIVARRPGGVAAARLAAAVEATMTRYAEHLGTADRELRLRLWPIEGTPMGYAMSQLLPYVLGVSVLLILVAACANVALLMIAQWTTREREIAIRASLGAGRGRIVRMLIVECLVLACASGTLGVAATLALRGVILHRTTAVLAGFDTSINPAIWLHITLVTIACGFAIGLLPATYETRRLHENPFGRIRGSERARQRWRHALVVVEIGVTVALAVELTTMTASYRRQLAAELGFPVRPLVSLRVQSPSDVPIGAILDRVSAVPEVSAAAASTVVPLATAFGPLERVTVESSGSLAMSAERAAVTPRFFDTLGVRLRGGRAFGTADTETSRTVIVNEALAARLFPSGDALGRSLQVGGVPNRIVGVVADYSDSPFQGPEYAPKFFVPLPPAGANRTLELLVRTAGDPAHLVQPVRRSVMAASAGIQVTRSFALQEVVSVGAQEALIGTAPLVPLTVVGVLLAAVGIYAVLALAVARRSRELAVRAAVGASRTDLARLVATQCFRVVAVGTSAGIAGMLGIARVVRFAGGAGGFFDVPSIAFVAPLVAVMGIALVATWIPSRRAMAIDPAAVLRSE